MSKEMIELADKIKYGISTEDYYALYPGSGKLVVAALRASAVAEPVAWTNQAQLGFLKERAYSELPMAMWSKRKEGVVDVALYAHPAPAAPAPASVREALVQRIQDNVYRANGCTLNCDVSDAIRSALASLPAPEAAPKREEIKSSMEQVLGDYRTGGVSYEQVIDAILALKAAPAKPHHVALGSDIDDGQRGKERE